MNRVVITGIGIISCLGRGQSEILDALLNARSGLELNQDYKDNGMRCHVSGKMKFSIDEIDSGKMTLKRYCHIGIAVDTPNGLMVPKLRNANNKNISLIAEELKNLSEKCRNLKIDKKELFGGSMTITSLGGIGGSFFTPIINYPEVAILGIGKSVKKQIYLNGKFKTRTMLPLSLSYDHRIIDGAEAARFNNELKENLGKNFAYKLAV